MDVQLMSLKKKVDQYHGILQNTKDYRAAWKDALRQEIIDHLENMVEATGLQAKVETRSDMENLEAVVLSLGETKSGMYQQVGTDIERHLIKHNGSLIYQQLFNGKVIVLINYPYIENYGQPRPPKTIAIYRPEELREAFFIRHMEEFITEITNWEDFDDDEPNKRIGFNLNFNPGAAEAQDGQPGPPQPQ